MLSEEINTKIEILCLKRHARDQSKRVLALYYQTYDFCLHMNEYEGENEAEAKERDLFWVIM